jgi:hypothetical protein
MLDLSSPTGSAIPQYAEQPELDQRQPVLAGDLTELSHHQERELSQAVHDPEILHGGSLVDMVRIAN